jgi:hypothetical protein
MQEAGKAIIGIGMMLVVIGVVLLVAGRFGLPLGRLPGDMAYKGKHASVYFPLGTSILISIVLTLGLYLLSRFRR